MTKALFLDRDGVINVEKDYLFKIKDFEFIDGIFELCRYYIKLGYIIIVVTNQSGIARDYYTKEQFSELTDWMLQAFQRDGVEISKLYYCPHHPDITGECNCRKPKPGMLLDAKKDFDIDLSKSLLVGDKERDIQAALNAGVPTTYLFDETNLINNSQATKIVNKLDEIWKG